MSATAASLNPLAAALSGVNLIEASAGTGKTYTIEALFLRLLLEKGLKVDSILVVTFTEAATAELRSRIAASLRAVLAAFRGRESDDAFIRGLVAQSINPDADQVRLRLALAEFDEAAIHTIHGFCLRTLAEFAFESGALFDTELLTCQDRLLAELAADYWRGQLYGAERHYAEMFLAVYPVPTPLAALAAKVLPRPGLRLLPRIAPIAPRQLYRQAMDLYRKLRDQWLSSREVISSLLLEFPHWKNHGKYRDKIAERVAGLAGFFERDRPLAESGLINCFTPEVIRQKTCKGAAPPQHPFFAGLARFLEMAALLPMALRLDFIDFARRELVSRKQRRNLRSFDDLLQDLHRVLVAGPSGAELAARVRGRFSAALIDEFQDTDPIQYEIFQRLFMTGKDPCLFFIGDPKQSIYRFRGADVFAYLRAAAGADQRYSLDRNFRSDQDLVAAINVIFGGRGRPFVEQRIGFGPSLGAERNPARGLVIDGEPPAPVTFWFRPAAGADDSVPLARREITEATAAAITRLLNLAAAGRARLKGPTRERPVAPNDIAVLVRSHREARQVQAALAKRRVAAVLNVTTSVFDAPEFADLRVIAGAVAECRQQARVRAALLTETMGTSATELDQLGRDQGTWEEVMERFRCYHECWATGGFFQMMRLLLSREQIRTRLLARTDGERRLTNLLHLVEIFHLAEAESQYSMAGLLQWADKLRSDGPSREQFQLRLETDAEAVRILTVHASKGLEFSLVFAPFCWGTGRAGADCFFHDPENDDALCWDLEKKEENKRLAAREELAEDLRLFYVAVTRAKHGCWVAWGDIPRTGDSCFNYLFHEGSPAGRRADLERLAAASTGNIVLGPLPEPGREIYVPVQVQAPNLSCRRFAGRLRQDWGIASFSGLLAQGKKELREGLDHDQPQVGGGELDLAGPGQGLPEEKSMLSFPGGSRTGDCFHEVLEQLDFGERNQQVIAALVREKLEKYGFDPEWTEAGVRLVRAVTSRRLTPAHAGAGSFCLGELTVDQVVKEMGFHFPITHLRGPELATKLAPLCRHASHAGLLASLRDLDFTALSGFMKGFIDLVFCCEGRFYILDWKTNNLGPRPADYTKERLARAITSHLFNLQYYIYTVALHRYLRQRLAGAYDFDRHFGGVYYFFLRGIASESENTGVFYDPLTDSGPLFERFSEILGGSNKK